MDRGEHQVPREGRLNGDRGRIQVAHLPHHDDVGVLPQHRPEHDGEGEADLLLHRHLVDPRQLVLDRVLDRRDVVLDGFDPVQDPIEGGRLSRSGGPRDEDDPLRTGDDVLHPFHFLGGKPDRLQGDVRVGGVEDPDDHFLPVVRRDRGDPQVEAAPPHADADPAVLREPLLGDVHIRHDLDPRDDRPLDPLRKIHRLAQEPVDPVTDLEGRLRRLHVDVGGPLIDRLGDDQVHHPDDGGGLGLLPKVVEVLPVQSMGIVDHLDLALVHDVLDDGAEGRSEVVVLVDGPEDVGLGGDERLDGEAGGEPDVLERLEAQRVGHRDVQVAAVDRDGDDEVFPGDLFLDQLDRLGLYGGVLQVDHGNAELDGEGLGDLLFRGQPEGDDHLSELSPLRALLREGARKPLLTQEADLEEGFPQPFLRHLSRGSPCRRRFPHGHMSS